MRSNSHTKYNDFLKIQKSKHFKSWNKIEKGIKKSISSNYRSISEMRPDWFIQSTDYSSNTYDLVCNVNDLGKESLAFWERLSVSQEWEEVVQFQEEKMQLNIPHLYQKTLRNLEFRRTMKLHFESSQQKSESESKNGLTEFDRVLHKYIKCLSKRKSDISKKLNKEQTKRERKDSLPETESDYFEEQEVFNDSPIHSPMMDTDQIQFQSKQINIEQLVEYQNQHDFIDWDKIIQLLLQSFQTFDDTEQTRRDLIKLLKNIWFITQREITSDSNTVDYLCPESLWNTNEESIPFADISNGNLRISVPKLFLQSKEKRSEVKHSLQYLLPVYYSQTIDSLDIQLPEKSIDSHLNTYCKRLSKRKHDFVDSILKGSIPVGDGGNEGTVMPAQILLAIPITRIFLQLELL